MSIGKNKRDSPAITEKDTEKVGTFTADIVRAQKVGHKFVVIDSKELEKDAESLLV